MLHSGYSLFVIYLVIFLFGYSMPLRKKNTMAQISSGDEQQVEASVDHVSMHTKGTKSSEEVK